MSAMALSMYQFTKGEGTLRTTQDLFTQAEYFAEEANRLYKVARQFSYQVPAGAPKKELLDHLDKVPTYVQTLQFTVKEPTVGKAATFVKVDHVIQETKNLMNVISKVVSTCFDCANKVIEAVHSPFTCLIFLTCWCFSSLLRRYFRKQDKGISVVCRLDISIVVLHGMPISQR
jgi:hypothetical protein